MCVIMICESEDKRPTEQMIEKAWAKNEDGGGIAWREKNKKGEKIVKWAKGLDYDELKNLIETLPAPFVAHFRIASQGGVRPSMTHPFPVTTNAELDLEGSTKGYVLFHNGNWKDWPNETRQAAIMAGMQIPRGKWSDTRAMAWLCAIYGVGYMEFLPDQKGVAFGPEDMEVFVGFGWKKLNDVWCSNDFFLNTVVQSNYRMCLAHGCTEKGNLDADQHCPKHPKVTPEVSPTPPGFRQTPNAAGPRISLERAERLHLVKKLSKNKLKEVRRLYLRISGTQPKEVLKALADLTTLTAVIDRELRG